MTIEAISPVEKLGTENSLRRVHLETWGCQMNVADSERMLALMKKNNYQLAESAEEADLIILNTCHIRDKARHKVVSRLGVLRDLKSTRPGMKIALTGCVAQAEGKKLAKDLPYIDVVIGPGTIDELPALLEKSHDDKAQKVSLGFPKTLSKPDLTEEIPQAGLNDKNNISRFVNITQGCNNFCTFCVVPFTRGREVSMSQDEIVAQVREFVRSGAKEVTLLGQNVNSYGLDEQDVEKLSPESRTPFVELLEKIVVEPGLERLRFTTSNPHDFTKPLADLFAQQPRLGKYMHLPVQSGSDRILVAMKRKVTVAEYMQRIHWLRQAVPDMAISTDLIVGFPGETDEDFAATLELVEKIRYSFVYAFKYSSRKGTAAARFKDQVSELEMTKRLAKLNAIQDKITLEFNQSAIGSIQEVLFTYESRKDPGVYYGRTQDFRLVRVAAGRDLVGAKMQVAIQEANKTALLGELFH